MNELNSLASTYSIDLALKPTTFDLWHVCLAGTVVILTFLVLLLLMLLLFSRSKNKAATAALSHQQAQPQPVEPTVKIIEKIIEVEKVVSAPIPEPVILKEYTPDAALQVLGLLQKEARFIDFLKEDITAYSDADIGAAARVVHDGCNKTLNEHFSLAPIRDEQEGCNITVPADFDAASIRLTGNIIGSAPFVGTLVHKGWQVTEVRLPKLSQNHNPNIVTAAEIEL